MFHVFQVMSALALALSMNDWMFTAKKHFHYRFWNGRGALQNYLSSNLFFFIFRCGTTSWIVRYCLTDFMEQGTRYVRITVCLILLLLSVLFCGSADFHFLFLLFCPCVWCAVGLIDCFVIWFYYSIEVLTWKPASATHYLVQTLVFAFLRSLSCSTALPP